MSNISFLGKLIEKVVTKQIHEYLSTNSLYCKFQSAYRKFYSTALVKVFNDIFISIGDHRKVVLVMLDLSAAFDTIDHRILLERLEKVLVLPVEHLGDSNLILLVVPKLSKIFVRTIHFEVRRPSGKCVRPAFIFPVLCAT